MKKTTVKNKITFKKKPLALKQRLMNGQTEGFTLADLHTMYDNGISDGIGIASPNDVRHHKSIQELRNQRFQQ